MNVGGGERAAMPAYTASATDAARQWEGWGTALKPACEPIVLARKPLSEKTVAANVLRWGTGAINVDGCRVNPGEVISGGGNGEANYSNTLGGMGERKEKGSRQIVRPHSAGRWPANVIHDGSDEVIREFPSSVGGLFPKDQKQGGGNVYGRWPANIIHDGSDEVLAGFPEQESGSRF